MMRVLASLPGDPILDALLRTLMHGGGFVLGVWLLCRAVPRLPPSIRSSLWWLAAAKLLIALVWSEPLPVPVLAGSAAVDPGDIHLAADTLSGALDVTTLARSAAAAEPIWPTLLVVSWILGVAIGAACLVRAACRTIGVSRRAESAGRATRDLADRLARIVGVRRTPELRLCRDITSPMVVGLRPPVILLPTTFTHLSRSEQEMALCHELVHVRRGDLWWTWLPALAERICFFNPLAHLAAREYIVAREAACDAEVLRLLERSPQEYGRLLLSLGVARQPNGFAAASAPQSTSILKRRLLMLTNTSSVTRVRDVTAWLAVAAAVCALVPVRLVARPAATPVRSETGAKAITAGDGVAGALRSSAPTPTSDSLVSAAIPAPTPAVSAMPRAHPDAVVTRDNWSSSNRDFSWVLLRIGNNVTMSGGSDDVARARRLRNGSEPLLWVRRSGQEYVIRDPVLIAQTLSLFEPVEQIGEQQGEIGARQGEIGRKQGEIGAKQGAVGARQAAIGAEQAAIGAKQAAVGARQAGEGLSDKDNAQLDADMKKLDAEMDALSKKMEALSAEMDAFNQPMEDLSKQMEPLSKQQEELGQQMEAAVSKAEAALKSLVDDAIRAGKATPVK
jgi:bla regulator protein blaR1